MAAPPSFEDVIRNYAIPLHFLVVFIDEVKQGQIANQFQELYSDQYSHEHFCNFAHGYSQLAIVIQKYFLQTKISNRPIKNNCLGPQSSIK